MKNPKELSSCTHTLPHAGNVLWGTKGEGFSPERSRQRGIKEEKLLLCASLELVKITKKPRSRCHRFIGKQNQVPDDTE